MQSHKTCCQPKQDPGAHQLAQSMSLKRKAAQPAAGAGGGGGGSAAMSEDAELARAIAMSLGQTTEGGSVSHVFASLHQPLLLSIAAAVCLLGGRQSTRMCFCQCV